MAAMLSPDAMSLSKEEYSQMLDNLEEYYDNIMDDATKSAFDDLKPIENAADDVIDDVIPKGASEGGNYSATIKSLQNKTPQQLLEDGWQDVTNPKMVENTTSREFLDSKTGLKIRFDKGVEGANGFEAVDHYHINNPNYTNKKVDYYLDINGNPVGKGSKHHILLLEEIRYVSNRIIKKYKF